LIGMSFREFLHLSILGVFAGLLALTYFMGCNALVTPLVLFYMCVGLGTLSLALVSVRGDGAAVLLFFAR